MNEYWSAQAVEEIKGMLYELKMQNYETACDQREYHKARIAPHVIHGAEIKKDGNAWGCILGDLPTGVCGFGNTPKEACDAFDKAWNEN